MKNLMSCIVLVLISVLLHAQTSKTALLIIDIQDFYFPGGFSELVEPETAAKNAASILNQFREKELPVIHIQHQTDTQMSIHHTVKPIVGETIIVKNEINCFNGTSLKAHIDSLGITTLVIVGMQTHMCVEAATRASYDYGYTVYLIEDACATKQLEYKNTTIMSQQVQASTFSTLANYAEILTTEKYLDSK